MMALIHGGGGGSQKVHSAFANPEIGFRAGPGISNLSDGPLYLTYTVPCAERDPKYCAPL